jgi:hypothetical protein
MLVMALPVFNEKFLVIRILVWEATVLIEKHTTNGMESQGQSEIPVINYIPII